MTLSHHRCSPLLIATSRPSKCYDLKLLSLLSAIRIVETMLLPVSNISLSIHDIGLPACDLKLGFFKSPKTLQLHMWKQVFVDDI